MIKFERVAEFARDLAIWERAWRRFLRNRPNGRSAGENWRNATLAVLHHFDDTEFVRDINEMLRTPPLDGWWTGDRSRSQRDRRKFEEIVLQKLGFKRTWIRHRFSQGAGKSATKIPKSAQELKGWIEGVASQSTDLVNRVRKEAGWRKKIRAKKAAARTVVSGLGGTLVFAANLPFPSFWPLSLGVGSGLWGAALNSLADWFVEK